MDIRELTRRVEGLSLRASVAFALRCASRVEPLARYKDPEAVADALSRAREYAEGSVGADFVARAHSASDAAYAAAYAARAADAAILHDLSTIEATNLTDDDYVPQTVFGEMWPNGAPEWWKQRTIEADIAAKADPAEARMKGAPPPQLDILIDPGDADPALIAKILLRLSDLHEAEGGFGLSFDGIEEFDIARELV